MYKFLIVIVVLAAAAGGLWYSGWLGKLTSMIPMPQKEAVQTPATTTPATPTPPAPQTPPNDLPTATNDASDSALAQDTAAIDAQIKDLGTDTTNSANSLSDKPITQEY